MDLVDIDKVLDNLELNEEEYQKKTNPPIKRRQVTTSINQVLSPSSANESDQKFINVFHTETQNHSTATNTPTNTGERVNKFVGVSQVFSSLDDYRKNVESLDLYASNKNNENTNSNSIFNTIKTNHHTLLIRSDKSLIDDDNDGNDNSDSDDNSDGDDNVVLDFKINKTINEEDEEENNGQDPYENDEINKFVSTDEYSNSITTSSSSTFSSGPSPALISTETESSLNNFINKENAESEVNVDEAKINSYIAKDGCGSTTSEGIESIQPNGWTESQQQNQQLEYEQQQQKSDFDDLALGLSSISLTTMQESNLSLSDIASASSKYVLEAENSSSPLSFLQITKNDKETRFKDQQNIHFKAIDPTHLENSISAEYNLVTKEGGSEVNVAKAGVMKQNVMITFSSTMDEISDTELDSILQEIDTEMQSQQFMSPDADNSSSPSQSVTGEGNGVGYEILSQTNNCQDGFKNSTSINISSLVPGSSKFGERDLMNKDSFSQASTLEFTEDRGDYIDENEIEKAVNEDLEQICGDTDVESKEKQNFQKRQRPTTLDLPAIKIDLYATAGQTPPGSRIYDHTTSSSEDETPDDVDQRCKELAEELKNNDEVNFNESAGHTPPERTDRDLDGFGNRSESIQIDIDRNNDASSSGIQTANLLFSVTNSSVVGGDVSINVSENKQTHHKIQLSNSESSTLLSSTPDQNSIPTTVLSEALASSSTTSSEVAGVIEASTNSNELSPVYNNQSINNRNSVNINNSNIGKVPPIWVPDQNASACMQCQHKFTLLKRRHHCRACGQVLCSVCCSQKFKLEFLSNLESRVCVQCFLILTKITKQETHQQQTDIQSFATASSLNQSNQLQTTMVSPNPNNPMEYCSKIPPHCQVNPYGITSYPSVIVPVGVLKKEGINTTKSRKRKSVMFSDGIRPGSDLASLDGKWSDAKHARKSVIVGRNNGVSDIQSESSLINGKNNTSIPKNNSKSVVLMDDGICCYIPLNGEHTLPPIIITKKSEKSFQEVKNNADLIKRLQSESLKFVIQNNFFVFVKISHLKCCINKTVINFTTCGLNNVGNDEIIILLELDNSNIIPKDIFVHLNEIYWEASRGHPITELGFSMPKHLNFLNSREYGGFLFIRSTFQCLLDIHVPDPPFLIGVLIHRYEVPWAKIFPLRLMLRLGAQYRYYPSPHISVREREPVYGEIAQTIINLLADFRNYTYTIPTIKGMYIHMEDRKTNILIPRNRLPEVIKAINNSSDHIIAMGANFSRKADGHLVCIQNTKLQNNDLHSYSTQAINIQGQPRKVTGASFFVLNEALKSTSGLSGKCSIIEDGLMVQILPSKMNEIRHSLTNMKDINIVCGPIESDEQQTEVVYIQWVDDDVETNIGVRSPIDSKKMDGISSIRIHSGISLSNNNHILKCTEVFIIEMSADSATFDVSKVSEQIAKNACIALLPLLDLLVANKSLKIGLRVTFNNEDVSYEAGSQNERLPPLYMNALDNELIQTLHKQANDIGKTVILELIFHILNVNINV